MTSSILPATVKGGTAQTLTEEQQAELTKIGSEFKTLIQRTDGALARTALIASGMLMGELAIADGRLDGQPVRMLCRFDRRSGDITALAVLLDGEDGIAPGRVAAAAVGAAQAALVSAVPPMPASALVSALQSGSVINDMQMGCGDPDCTNCGGDGSLLNQEQDAEAPEAAMPEGAVLH